MKKLVTTIALVSLLVTAIVPQTSCSGETGEPEAESNHFLELLNVIPANESTLKSAYIQDFTYLSEQIEKYPEVMDRYHIGHANPLTGAKGYDEEEWKQTLGFVLEDVEQSIYAGAADNILNNYEAVRGNFTQEDIAYAAKNGPMNDLLEIVSYDGYELYSWGEDNTIDLERRSNVRPMGRGHRLAYIDGFVFWVTWTDGMKEMIESYQDNIDSLADIENYKLMSNALSEIDVAYAFFSNESQSYSNVIEWQKETPQEFGTEELQRFTDLMEDATYLKPFQAFATGVGIDKKGFYMAIVLVNSDESTARENAGLLEQRFNQTYSIWRGFDWSDLIEGMEIGNDGRLTTAKLYGPIVEYWVSVDMYSYRSPSYEPFLVWK